MLKNIFSIDLEEWYAFKGFKEFVYPKNKIPQLRYSIKPLLELLDKYDINATFFVLGDVAEKYPDLIETIYLKGHEIASHGYSHISLSNMDKDKFKEEFLKLSKSIIDPEAEPKGEFELDIEFDEMDTLQFEEDQELNDIFEDIVDRVADSLTFIDEEEDED